MQQPSDIILQSNPPQLEQVDFSLAQLADKDTYEKELKNIQQDLLCLQQALFHVPGAVEDGDGATSGQA